LENFSMKKTLIALAAVAATTGVFAQATISGSMDFDVKFTNGTGTSDKTSYDQGDVKLNFTASEDLGGGLTAGVRVGIEAKGANGNVTADHALVTLGHSSIGTLTAGRVVAGNGIMARGQAGAPVMGFDGSILGAEAPRATLGFASARVMGLQATYGMTSAAALVSTANPLTDGDALGVKQFSNKSGTFAGKAQTLGVNYSEGAISAAADWTWISGAATQDGRGRASISYDLGVAKIGAGYEFQGDHGDNYTVGFSAPIGALTVGAAFSGNSKKYTAFPTGRSAANLGNGVQDATALELGAQYAFSKRTNAGLAYAYLNTEGMTAVGVDGAHHFRVRLSHGF